jgi:SulP family sulfate permease
MVHALTVLCAVVALAPLIGYLPMASLAALLLLVAWNMSEMQALHPHRAGGAEERRGGAADLLPADGDLRHGDRRERRDRFWRPSCSCAAWRRLSQTRLIDAEHPAAPDKLPDGVLIYDISGPLFFGAAQKAMATLGVVDTAKTVILRMNGVPMMDATGLVALESALAQLSKQRC